MTKSFLRRWGVVVLTTTLFAAGPSPAAEVESVLILRPDGTGSWGYHAGFDILREPDFRDGQRIDPRTLVEYDKWRYDPLEPVTVVGGDINLLRLYYGQHMFSGRAGVAHAVGLYPTGRIMVCGEDRVYGWQEGYEGVRSPAFVASAKAPRRETINRRGKKASRLVHDWSKDLPLHVFGLVLAGDALFIAGPPRIDALATRDLLARLTRDQYDPPPALREALESFSGNRGGLLCALRASDGAKIWQGELHSVPVFDGLIAAPPEWAIQTRWTGTPEVCLDLAR